MRNIRLLLEYDGTRYHGWQRQLEAATIQGVLEAAVARLTQAPVAIIGSGRTDAGVHARGQVANFRTSSAIPLQAFHQGLNSLLPKDIAVLEALEAPPEFHARKSARAKTYVYRILNRPNRSPLARHYAWWLALPLDLAAMAGAAAFLPGEHDFTAFRASGSDNLNPVRRVLAATWRDEPGGWLSFTITATGFLRGMVRSLVGTLAEVGQGKAPPTKLAELLTSGARHLAGPTAPPQGLYLAEVFYENEAVSGQLSAKSED
ncbi:MAG: tRNA pseudouridine(38-40) synthase TruA [Proteobacteria bacterium]|nr:tRNA pseudouridine(38-40) synthase TruA [Pseudomonadota bacterium]MBU4355581.1 tRNA pseudouridine(38-40) synthase TruA [Pseudomonadota bacterium]